MICLPGVDTRYSRTPLAIEPGPDWAELGATADFAAKPAFWCWNQVALREAPGVTAYFDWPAWPVLEAALLRWLAPQAGEISAPPPPAPPLSAEDMARLQKDVESSEMDDLSADAPGRGKGCMPGGEDEAGGIAAAPSRKLDPKALAVLISQLRAPRTSQDAVAPLLIAGQLARVENLPEEERWACLDMICRKPPANLAETGRRCVRSLDPGIRGVGWQCLAVTGDPLFAKSLRRAEEGVVATDPSRGRYLALALAMYPKDDLKDVGRARLANWERQYRQAVTAYTHGKGFSDGAPEVPCLDSESIFARAGWLAYMARWEPATYAAALTREWAMTPQDEDYCRRNIEGIRLSMSYKVTAKDIRREQDKIPEVEKYQRFLPRFHELVRRQVESLVKAQPREVAAGFSKASFRLETLSDIGLLGALTPGEGKAMLEALKDVRQPLLSAFAAARLEGAK